MRDLVTSQVAISKDEVWDAFVREKETVKLKYARFSPVYYQQQHSPSESELKAFIDANLIELE